MKEPANNQLYYFVWIQWLTLAAFALIAFGIPFFTSPSQLSLALLGLHAVSNSVFHLYYKKTSSVRAIILIFLLWDILVLTLLLIDNGGAHNPFSSLVLVFCGLAALLLPLRSVLFILAVTLGALYSIYASIPATHASHDFNLHLRGMWLANSLGVCLLCGWIYYTKMINERLLKKNEATQKILGRIERLESVGRLGAEAAHRINTPLGTLQLGLSELADTNNPLSATDSTRWAKDMQHAIDQISSIISLIDYSHPIDDSLAPLGLNDFIFNWVNHWSVPRRITVSMHILNNDFLIKPESAENLGHALTVLLDNACEALDKTESLITLESNDQNEFVFLKIKDNGMGMDDPTVQKAFEPLFTTKKEGTGLGLFLCRQFALKFGGSIHIDSTLTKGTTVTLKLKKELL